MDIELREIAHGSPDYGRACELRNELLRLPLGLDLYDEDLDAEAGWAHVAGFEATQLVAYLQLKPLGDGEAKMQQVAVIPTLQGRGIGRRLVRFSERVAAQRGWPRIVLHAREPVVGFYESLGYLREGERFIEVRVPHFRLSKRLDASP